jgi:tetratricopeptide (TPR) repeat protein
MCFTVYRKSVARENVPLYLATQFAACEYDLARLLLNRGQYQESENLIRESLCLLDRISPDPRDRLQLEAGRAMGHCLLARVMYENRQTPQAKEECRLSLEAYEKALGLIDQPDLILNDFAWFLATCPDVEFRDAKRAVELATRAARDYKRAARHSKQAEVWNTLGVAHYRNGDWKSAIEALTHSTELGKGGHSFDFFFLAMAHWHLGDKEQARQWYEKATEWMKKYRPIDEELRRFREEAAQLLGIEENNR